MEKEKCFICGNRRYYQNLLNGEWITCPRCVDKGWSDMLEKGKNPEKAT